MRFCPSIKAGDIAFEFCIVDNGFSWKVVSTYKVNGSWVVLSLSFSFLLLFLGDFDVLTFVGDSGDLSPSS